jgi:tRNA threonylcarbamoyl adenosine modification protein YeaZ
MSNVRSSAVRDGNGGRDSPFGGLLLAMDTAGREGSAAIATRKGGDSGRLEVLARVSLRADEEHASLLVPRIQGLMEGIAADREELSGIIVGAGPGSFTGVRVAAATAKGFARALNVPLWAFSSLAAAAMEDGSARGALGHAQPAWPVDRPESRLSSDFDTMRPRCVLFDARGDRVYAAAYRLSGGRLETLMEPRASTLQEMLDGELPPGALLMGDGAVRHRAILEDGGHPVLPPPFGQPTACGLIRLLSLEPETPPLEDPGRWEPDYVRTSGAERMWKTRKGMEG